MAEVKTDNKPVVGKVYEDDEGRRWICREIEPACHTNFWVYVDGKQVTGDIPEKYHFLNIKNFHPKVLCGKKESQSMPLLVNFPEDEAVAILTTYEMKEREDNYKRELHWKEQTLINAQQLVTRLTKDLECTTRNLTRAQQAVIEAEKELVEFKLQFMEM